MVSLLYVVNNMDAGILTTYEAKASAAVGLLPDTYNCGLRMRRECRESFPPTPTSKKTAS